MNKILIATLFGLSLIANAEEKKVYKTIDEHGNVTFSDVPVKDAEEVKVPTTPTFSTPDYSSMLPKETNQPEKIEYEKVSITSPKHDQVFWNVEANSIPVSTSLEPGLQPGHKLLIKLNGKPIDGSILSDLYRGSYELVAEVHDSEGEVLISSKMVAIHIKRTMVKKKAKPDTPK